MEHTFKTSSKFHSNDVALPRPEWQPRSQALSPLPPVFTKEAEERRGCQNAIFRVESLARSSLRNGNRPQHEALGNKSHKLCSYSPEPRNEVYWFKLNFNIAKLVYYLNARNLLYL